MVALKARTVSGRHRDARFAPTMVMRQKVGVCSAAALRKGNTTRGECADQCQAEGLSMRSG